jgi:hypothetical protein
MRHAQDDFVWSADGRLLLFERYVRKDGRWRECCRKDEYC